MEKSRRTLQQPKSVMISEAIEHWDCVIAAERITGHSSSRKQAVFTAYTTGFRRGAKAINDGELMDENDALQNAFIELDLGQRQTIALRELLFEVILFVNNHNETCVCNICMAYRKHEESYEAAQAAKEEQDG